MEQVGDNAVLRTLDLISTSCACCSIDMFLWMIPKPPSRAMAIAVFDSVTVSIAADRNGMFSNLIGQPCFRA